MRPLLTLRIAAVALSALALTALRERPVFAEEPADQLTAEQRALILDAAKKYTLFGLVKPEPDRSPANCFAPGPSVHPALSEAKTGDDGHGTKLYYLFAKDFGAYRVGTGLYVDWSKQFPGMQPATPPAKLVDGKQPVGQVIVKESWTDHVVAKDEAAPTDAPKLPGFAVPTTWLDGVAHRVGERSALFIMAKVGQADAPATDAGWVYATVTPDGERVTSGGLLPRCMGCHQQAKADRLFGPKVH